MKSIVLKIDGMSCAHCQNHVKNAFAEVKGVAEVSVDLENDTASIIFNEDEVSEENIKAALDNTTYTVL